MIQRKYYGLGQKFILVAGLIWWCTTSINAQNNVTVKVVNDFTKEPVAFAGVSWKRAGFGSVTDSAGTVLLKKSSFKTDTLVVQYVGFDKLLKPFNNLKDSIEITIFLKEAKVNEEVVVKSKFSKGLRWWKSLVSHKTQNNPYRYKNYSYELYTKVELDLNNMKANSFDDHKRLKPFSFILDNIDSTSDVKPFLPVFLTESLSDYYYSNNPHKVREEIKAVQTNGIKNESVLQFLGGVSQKVNVYDDYIILFNKEFISPTSPIGDRYYNYRGADTQYINKQRFFHLFFTPKQEGSNTFSGDCWIHSTTWAVQKMNLTASPTANINFVHRLSLVQEFTQQQDSSWVVLKDKVVADISPFKKDKLSFLGRKTTMYRDIKTDRKETEQILAANKRAEEVIVSEEAQLKDRAYWNSNRQEDLNSNEKKVYQLIDTLNKMPLFIKYKNFAEFVIDGHKKFGMIEIGPWHKWFSGNSLEKSRLRFDIGTTEKFSKHLRLYGYMAYGFGDGRWKGKAGFTYKLNKNEQWSVGAYYMDDLDNGRIRFRDDDEASIDNLFSRFIRREGITQKFLGQQRFKMFINKNWESNLSAQLSFTRTNYETFTPFPARRPVAEDDIINSELRLNLRYAPDEKKITGRRKSFAIKGKLPVMEAGIGTGIPGFMGSEYNFKRYTGMISQTVRLPRWGNLEYMAYGGHVSGKNIPFMLLEVHPGNEVFYYSKQSFNLMNRFEYVSDFYGGINIEHNFEKKLFNLIPFMRKTNMRQFWNVKSVWGDLSMDNRRFRTYSGLEFGSYRLKTLRGKPYIEVGTGIDNICRFFRLDLVWRFDPAFTPPAASTLANNVKYFGIFGSFKLKF